MCVSTSEDQDEQQEAGQQAHGGNQDVEEKPKVIGGAQLVGTRLPAHPRLGSSSQILCGTQRDIQRTHKTPGSRLSEHKRGGFWLYTVCLAPPLLPLKVIFTESRGVGARGVSALSEFPLDTPKLFLKRYDNEPTPDTTQQPPALNTAHSTTLSLCGAALYNVLIG